MARAATAPLEAPARSRPARAPAARPRQAARRRSRSAPGVLGGVVWIVLIAALLTGVVALNVAALQANLRVDRLDRERASLRAANAALSVELSSAAAAPQVQAKASRRLGLVPADPESTTYVELRARAR